MLAAFGSDYRHSTPPHVKAVHRVSVRGILSHGGLRKDNPDIKGITGFYRSPGIAEHRDKPHGLARLAFVEPAIKLDDDAVRIVDVKAAHTSSGIHKRRTWPSELGAF